MASDPHTFAGLAAAALSLSAGVVYIIDIVSGRAQPHRATWWILGILNCAIAASYYAAGAFTTLWLPLEFGVSFLVVAFLSVKYGEGEWRRVDTYLLSGAVVGVIVWWLSRSAPLALALFTIVDLVGLAPTIRKAYLRPWTEASSAWAIGTLAGFLNVLAIDDWAPEISLYPLYVFVTSGLVAAFVARPLLWHQARPVS